MIADYLPIAILVILSAAVAVIVIVLGHSFGPKRPSEAKGMAYESAGDVSSSVDRFSDYLKLSKRNMEEMQADGSIRPSGGSLTAFDLPLGPGIRIDPG